MEISVLDARKLVEIWLTNAEQSDHDLRADLQPIYDQYKKKKYLVAVFKSGHGNLYENTRDLLFYHRRKQADHAMKQQKTA